MPAYFMVAYSIFEGPSLKFRLVRQKTDIPVPEVERFARWLVESWRRDMVFPSA